jgi:hypothetical protein
MTHHGFTSSKWCMAVCLFTIVTALLLFAAPAAAAKYALLVGCTRYVELGETLQLAGTGNDVELLRDLLIDRYGFGRKEMMILTEDRGDALPTRDNIRKGFGHLARVAGRGDVVVILLAGHGAQQPVPPGNDLVKNYEPDGLDEVFCPRDVLGIKANGSGRITNGIVDDEISRWLEPILDNGALVWVIFDACHSGTMIRGNGSGRVRAVPPGVLLSEEQLAQSKKRASPVSAALPEPIRMQVAKQHHLVALYACQASEVETEDKYPANDPDAKRYGLLTYSLVRILRQCRTPITYRDLVQHIHFQYLATGRDVATPFLEGADQDRPILDDSVPSRPQPILLMKDRQGLAINAGAIHGLSDRSIIAVYPPSGDEKPRRLLGHARITKLGIPSSRVEPCAYGRQPATEAKDLPRNARCELVLLDYGLNRLRVAVADHDVAGAPVDPAVRKQWAHALHAAMERDPKCLIRYVEDSLQADWLVRLDGRKMVLVPGSGWPLQPGRTRPPVFEPDAGTTDPDKGVKQALDSVARATNLIRLASMHRESAKAQFGKDLEVDVAIESLKDKDDRQGKLIPWGPQGRTIEAGTLIRFQIENRERVPIDVTLLYVDSQYGITAVFPERGGLGDNRIEPNSVRVTSVGILDPKTLGLEHVVLLAAKARPRQPPADFSLLEQPCLNEAVTGRAVRGSLAARGVTSPLAELLSTAVEGEGNTRAASSQIGQYAIRLISLQLTAKRP